MSRYTIPFAELGRHDVALVGGKNSSLGEMIANLASLGVTVPEGFATTADAYREFLAQDGLAGRLRAELATLDVDDVARLAETGARIRGWILQTPFPARLQREIVAGYELMCTDGVEASVAVRSSATAEDLPEASFAGQQDYADVMATDQPRFNRFFHAMLEGGFYFAPALYEAGFVSAAHSADDVAATVHAARTALRA